MPLSRRQILRRRRAAVFGAFGIVLSAGVYLPFTLLAPLSSSAATILPWQAPVTTAPVLDWPDYGASAFGAVGFPGTLASSGSAEAVPIASITKVITALVVLEAKPLSTDESGPEISFTAVDVKLYNSYLARNGKVEPVRAGLVLSQRQVLELTVVASANNYTASLVNWAFGSEEQFLLIARAWLDANGLANIVLADSTGMSPDNRGTAIDLVELGKLALAHPIVSVMVDTEHISIPMVGEIDNTNELLGDGGLRGIKTGTLDEAGACLLFAADYQIGAELVTVVGVMLGGVNHPQLDQDILELLTTVQTGFHEVALTTVGTEYASYDTAWDDRSDVVATLDATVVVWADTPITLLVESSAVTLQAAGSKVGTLSFSAGTRTVEVPLALESEIDDPGAWWRLTHPGELL